MSKARRTSKASKKYGRSSVSLPKAGSSVIMNRLQEALWLCLLGFAAFIFISLLTHDKTILVSKPHLNSERSSGVLGVWLADVLFVFWGQCAYFIPAGLLLLTWAWFFHKNIRLSYRRSLLFLMSIFLGAGILDIVKAHSGGLIGQILSSWFKDKLGNWGSLCVLLPLLLISISAIFEISCLQITLNIALQLKRPIEGMLQILLNCQKWINSRMVRPQRKMVHPFSLEERPTDNADQMHNPAFPPKITESNHPIFYTRPDLELLEPGPVFSKKGLTQGAAQQQRLKNLSEEVEENLHHFGIEVKVLAAYPGPVITRLEIELAAGVKSSRITALSKDLARALSVSSVRVVEVIPGKSCIGLEVPNPEREMVKLKEILQSQVYQETQAHLPLSLGKDIAGQPVIVDLARMPHLLVAGTTGSGKSVGVNAMLLSLLYNLTPQEVRLILVDPKMLELSAYEAVPHLLTPVVTDMKDAYQALKWCVNEMERRYQIMSDSAVRNILGYNQKNSDQPLPYIVIIIDEFADMMMVVGKKVEELITRISQKARAAGIHMILATQRPSVDVITGLIKANIPTRIAFQVSSRIDSRTILDQQGAEQLLGHGDMLYLPPGTGIPQRIHGAFVSDEEVYRVVESLKAQSQPEYIEAICNPSQLEISQASEEEDELFQDAVQIVLDSKKANASYLQRRLKIGYNRAARLIESMEERHIISALQSNGNREILLD